MLDLRYLLYILLIYFQQAQVVTYRLVFHSDYVRGLCVLDCFKKEDIKLYCQLLIECIRKQQQAVNFLPCTAESMAIQKHILTKCLYCVECPQYSIRLEVLGYLCTSCLLLAFHGAQCDVTHQSMIIGCMRLSDVSVICRVVNPRRTSQKCGEVSCTKCPCQGNGFELIPAVKMETRNPIEGYFGSKCWAICNLCGVMAA